MSLKNQTREIEVIDPQTIHGKTFTKIEVIEDNAKRLQKLQKLCSKDLYEDIEHYLKECYSTYQYEITDKQPNEVYKQKEQYEYLKEAYVNQYTNGGYAGDEFAGQVWIEISKNKWFTFHYSM